MKFNGKYYWTIDLLLQDGEVYTIADTTLQDAILSDNPMTEEGERVDEGIFFYIEPNEAKKPIADIIELMNRNLSTF